MVWLPEGDWYQVFSGEHYRGDRWHAIYGGLAIFRCLPKPGPSCRWPQPAGGHRNPHELHLHVFAGADHRFTLYEDDGKTTAYESGAACWTTFAQTWQGDKLSFSIEPLTGDTNLIPAQRQYNLSIHGVHAHATLEVRIDGQPVASASSYDADTETLHIEGITLETGASLHLTLRSPCAQSAGGS